MQRVTEIQRYRDTEVQRYIGTARFTVVRYTERHRNRDTEI